LDAEPLIGPVQGGTEVNLWGSQFEKNRNITCFFNEHQVQAKYISK
jgi:large repetitive protein